MEHDEFEWNSYKTRFLDLAFKRLRNVFQHNKFDICFNFKLKQGFEHDLNGIKSPNIPKTLTDGK